jgi:hypothetical protein
LKVKDTAGLALRLFIFRNSPFTSGEVYTEPPIFGGGFCEDFFYQPFLVYSLI